MLTKADLVDDPEPARRELVEVAFGVPVIVTSGHAGGGIEELRTFADGGRTLAFLGASGVGKSTLVNALLGSHVQATTEVRTGDDRGRHTTVAAELLPLPNGGWLVDTPGIRALSLWLSGDGIERAFADVFDLMEHCRFRDCKHDQEPGCAVRAAIAEGAWTRTASTASSAWSPRRSRWRPSSGPAPRPATAAAAAVRHPRPPSPPTPKIRTPDDDPDDP